MVTNTIIDYFSAIRRTEDVIYANRTAGNYKYYYGNPLFSDYFNNKPLVINSSFKNTEMIERAGNKILFKVGAVIGPQVEMYQEKPRQLPFAHVLNRKIILNIPDGYNVKNLNDLNMNVEYKENGDTTMAFVSSYFQTGNIITVLIGESYNKISYPVSEFEDFKKVINASADFNKVVLVFEKK